MLPARAAKDAAEIFIKRLDKQQICCYNDMVFKNKEHPCWCSTEVVHFIGNEEVGSSILLTSSKKSL